MDITTCTLVSHMILYKYKEVEHGEDRKNHRKDEKSTKGIKF